MTRTDALHHLADVASLLVQDADLAGVLVTILRDATEAAGADAVGLLVLNRRDELEMLSATSHEARAVEAWQAATGVGPCTACMTELRPVSISAGDAAEAWPDFARVMTESGYRHVVATPLRWRGRALGGLNLFWERHPSDGEVLLVAQAFADAATLALVASIPLGEDDTRRLLNVALQGRVVIEQAKGVLAYQRDLPVGHAFEELLRLADERGASLSDTAEHVVRAAELGQSAR